LEKGLVIRSTGSWYEVLNESSGKVYRGRLRGKHKKDGIKATNPIAVGDYVQFADENPTENTVLIHEIVDRENYVIRQSTHKKWHKHVIAANVDQVVVMATLGLPRTSLGFVDRCLVSAESFQIPGVVLFNKLDLLNEEALDFQTELVQLYESIGYTCLQVSAQEGTNMEVLEAQLKGKKSLIMGHSGVGKSTLINWLIPEVNQRTQEVSTFANKGVHTTTFAEMFRYAEGSYLIDTPGIKELGIMDLEENEVGLFFPDIKVHAENCKYYNCTHLHEPGCAVLEAVQEGQIAISRFKSYISILEGDDNRR